MLSAQDNESLRRRPIRMNVIVVRFYLLRLRDSGTRNKHLQQKPDDTELVFLIVKRYMRYMPVPFPARLRVIR